MIKLCVFFQLQELALKIAHLTDNAQARRRMLDHETMETHTAQVCILCLIYSFIKMYLYRVNMQKMTVLQCRVFVKDFLSRDRGLHSRDHSPSPNHNAPLFLMVFASLHNRTVLHVWFT